MVETTDKANTQSDTETALGIGDATLGFKNNSAAIIGYALLLTCEFICLHSATVLAGLTLPSHALVSLFALSLMAGQVVLFAVCAFMVHSVSPRLFFLGSLLAGGLFALGLIGIFLLESGSEALALPRQPILLVSGVCMGLASGLFNLLWAHNFSSLPTGQLYRQVIVCYLVALFIYLLITVLPSLMIVPVILLCVIGSTALLTRTSLPSRNLDQPSPPSSLSSPSLPSLTRPLLARVAHTLWRPVLCTAIFAFMSGLMSQIAGLESVPLQAFQQISIIASLIVVGILLLPALLLKYPPDITSAYRIALPITAAGFLLLPFIWNALFGVTNALVNMGFMAVWILLWCLLVDTSAQTGLLISLVFGSCLGLAKLADLIGALVGYAFASSITQSVLTLAAVALVSIYLLSMVSLFIFKGQRFVREAEGEVAGATGVGGKNGGEDESLNKEPSPVEKTALFTHPESSFAQRCKELSLKADLTQREQEMLPLLAQGRSIANVSKLLYVTENTTKSHVRSIYQKLEVHSKQELIDLVNEPVKTDNNI